MTATVTYAKRQDEFKFGFAVRYGKNSIAVSVDGGMYYSNDQFNYSISELVILSAGKFSDKCKAAIKKAIINYHEMAE